MTDQDAGKLAERIKREAWHQVRVVQGKTNGLHTFHIFDTQARDKRTASTTIYTVGEWMSHPLNLLNKPQTKREEGLDEYITRFTHHTASIQASVGRLGEAALVAASKMAEIDLGRE